MKQPFGITYRLKCSKRNCKCRECLPPKNGAISLARFKSAEYLIRWVEHNPHLLTLSEVLLPSLKLLPKVYLKELLLEVVKMRRGELRGMAVLKKCEYSLKEVLAHLKSGHYLIVLENHLSTIRLIRQELGPKIIKHLNSTLQKMARYPMQKDDGLLERMSQLGQAIGLEEVELEMLLYAHLRKSEAAVSMIHERLQKQNPNNDMRHEAPQIHLVAMLLGSTPDRLEKALAQDSALSRFNLMDKDWDLDADVSQYLSHGGKGSILERYFHIHTGDALALEAHSLTKEDCEFLVEVLNSHKGLQPLHILLHGMEGTGKTELSRTLGVVTHRTVYEVGRNLEASLTSGGDGSEDSIIRYGLRSLTIVASQAKATSSLLVMDEADNILNHAEKGKLNQMMESIHTPVIWITNSIRFVERSTLRRFDYSIAFRKLNDSQRKSLWNRILVKHEVPDLLPSAVTEGFSKKYTVAAGGIELAVRNAKNIIAGMDFASPIPVMEKILKAHGKLLNMDEGYAHSISLAPTYTLEGLNLGGNLIEILETARSFNDVWKAHDTYTGPCNLTALLHGPPGTGKSEFARFLAREMDRPLLLKRGSDLQGPYVGETEKHIRAAFEEAKDQGAILFLDEADSFLQNREHASRSWEISQVNELLTQMEHFTGVMICATNFQDSLDPASRRRFHLKLEFGYLRDQGALHFWRAFFDGKTTREPSPEEFRELCSLPLLAPGDFKAVHEKLRYLPSAVRTPERILLELRQEIAYKDSRAGRTLGIRNGV